MNPRDKARLLTKELRSSDFTDEETEDSLAAALRQERAAALDLAARRIEEIAQRRAAGPVDLLDAAAALRRERAG